MKLALKIFIIILGVSFTVLTFRTFYADYLFTQGKREIKAGNVSEGFNYLERAVALNPNEPTYTRTAAFYWASVAGRTEGAAERSAQLAEVSYQSNPLDSLTLKKLIHTYYLLSTKDDSYYPVLKQLADKLVQRAPTEPRAHYYRALVLSLGKEYQEARAEVDLALKMKKDFLEAVKLKEAIAKNSRSNP